MTSDVKDLFMCLFVICVFFGKMSIQVLCPFLIRLFVYLMLSCISSLHILDINPPSPISFANIFSHSVGGLFVLVVVSLAVQNLFGLM